MAWFPISNVVPQYWKQAADGTNEYSGAVLKAYQVGTITNIPFATDNTGDTTANSIALNANGNPEVSGNVVIPHLDQDYKLALYPDQTSADADSGAIWTIPDIDLMGFDSGSLNPEHATDTGTDTYESATNTSAPDSGTEVVRDFQSTNSTTTPTLDSITLKDRDGNPLYPGAINGAHRLYYDGTDYRVLDLRSTAGVVDPEHATDSGTDTYVSATNTSAPAAGVQIVRDFQSANTTTTPTLDSKTITTRDGSALWANALSGPHTLQLASDSGSWLVLDPITTQNLGRPFQSTADKTITVGTDASTIQDAVEQVPLLLRHRWTIKVPDGTYAEDVIVPDVYVFLEDPDGATTGDGALLFEGNKTTPANVKIHSIYFSGGNTDRMVFDGFEIIKDGPRGDSNAPFEVRNGAQVVLQAVNFANDTGSLIGRAISVYGGHVIGKGPLDFGTDLYRHAIVVKSNGSYSTQQPSEGTTGVTTQEPYWNQHGYLTFDQADTLRASSTDANHRKFAQTTRAPVFSFNSDETERGQVDLEGTRLKNLFPLSGNVGGADQSIANTNSIEVSQVRIHIPPRRRLVLRRVRYSILNTNLTFKIAGSNATFTAATSKSEETPETVLSDNSGSASEDTGEEITLTIENNSGGGSTLQAKSTWIAELALE